MNNGFTHVFGHDGTKYIAVTGVYDGDTSSLEAAHEDALGYFIQLVQNQSSINSLNIETDSTENINGLDVYKFEGTFSCGNEDITYDSYAIGYSFIMDDTPCNIIGYVDGYDDSTGEKNIDQSLADEIKQNVEAMIYTVRSEE